MCSEDAWLAPDFIDLQVNGYAGHDVNQAGGFHHRLALYLKIGSRVRIIRAQRRGLPFGKLLRLALEVFARQG